jgi:hypothetical protein
MKLVHVDSIPEPGRVCAATRSKAKPLKEMLMAFMKKGDKYARVDYDFDEYADDYSAAQGVRASVRRNKFPIGVRFRNGEIYIERLDI